MNSERIVERNGRRYKVTLIEHSQVMPWGTEPVSFKVAQWELLPCAAKPKQLDLF